ncbi:uncharacterized protein LOC120258697 [Dioscorea cayenensis subsp. rotundata]|uniref:Uncharacterized protein LOC120258697 n=1 Tax=Dioscorea cayennensis subsp. rotundata TaxID=55577 RepID=A0AB40B4V7_DIOCR|nr:uncharacterized protein LOC120258697 [Dioscorea cayenensis subsp. rotundata]
MVIYTFYNGLNSGTKQLLDATTGGTLGNKYPKEAQQLIEEMAKDSTGKTTEIPQEKLKDKVQDKEKGPAMSPLSHTARIPYTARLKKDQSDEQNRKFLDLFKQLHINIPFVEPLSQMLRYIKFLKDLLTNKRKMEDSVVVVLEGNCSAMLQKNLPNKMKDPGSFIILCVIRAFGEEKALANSRASINFMPYTLFQKLGLGEPRPTNMTLQLGDPSVRHPRDVDKNSEVPLILGRPFLRTSKALIDMNEDVNDEIANEYLHEFFASESI